MGVVGHANGVVRRVRSVARVPLTASITAACVALVLLGAGGVAQARLAPLRPTSPALKPVATYQDEANADSKEIAAHIGHGPHLPIKVLVNPKQENGPVPAYTLVYDSSGGATGPPAVCKTYVNPSFSAEDAEYQTLALIHEVFHCYEAADFPTVDAFQSAPAWLIEGEAEWVGATLAPTELPAWDAYLTGLSTSLFARSYDAIGFYSHMTESGDDTWHLLDKMLKAGGSAAAYTVAANKQLRLTWASSLARQSFGKGWKTTGPGITGATYHPGIHQIALGSNVNETVAPYTNALVRFQVTTAKVVDISATTQYSRLHTAKGTEYDDLSKGPNAFCVTDCTMCPQVQSLPRLTTGTNWLAVTGDAAGASYSIAGAPVTCSACLVGRWVVTNFTLTTNPGGSYSGGAGTTVDIQADGTSIGNFTPGAPLVGATGSVKFNGVETDHYGFPADTTARSGGLSSSTIVAGATITVGYPGGVTVPVKPAATSGNYSCVGTGLKLHFVGGPTTLDYTLVPAG